MPTPPQTDFASFAARYEAGKPQVLSTSLVADLETPVSAMLRLAADRPNSFLLESVEGGASRGRYSFIGFNPDLIWRCRGNVAEINRNPAASPDSFERQTSPSLESLREIVAESKIELPEGLSPMAACLIGYLSYDSVRLMERLPDANPDVLQVPDGIFMRPTIVAVFDTVQDSVTIVTPVRPAAGIDAHSAFDAAQARLEEVVAGLEMPIRHAPASQAAIPDMPEFASNMSREQFHAMVEKVREYIFAGDAFQVVASQRFSLPFDMPPFALYRALRRLNPSPFLFYLDFGDFHVVGSSPEILVRLRDNTVTIRPIAGTRPRGKDAAEDRQLEEELLGDPKERAEHLMLLDLGRNDVGRVSKIGTVSVTEKFVIEHYSHVMHIASEVQGELDPSYDAVSALIAGFPAGTVSGAPKVRAMEIIDEVEPERRGIYAGCIGYFGAGGDMDTCIALRTAVVKDKTLYIQAGGGIVADSSPEGEYQESWNKARALMRAAQEAYRYVGGRARR